MIAEFAECRESAGRLKSVLTERPTVALIEDDEAVAKAYSRCLASLASVIVFTKADLFVPTLQRTPFDLVLTDRIGLPYVERIKEVAPDLQIVVVSGMEAPPQLPVGVALWLVKPIPTETLYALVERELDVFGLTMIS